MASATNPILIQQFNCVFLAGLEGGKCSSGFESSGSLNSLHSTELTGRSANVAMSQACKCGAGLWFLKSWADGQPCCTLPSSAEDVCFREETEVHPRSNVETLVWTSMLFRPTPFQDLPSWTGSWCWSPAREGRTREEVQEATGISYLTFCK